MRWALSWRADPAARVIADRHYSRQTVGADQFVPPGRCLVLVIPEAAYWVTSWPFTEHVKHAWAGDWTCSAFRNERPDLYLSSDLIREAVAATRWWCANIRREAEPAGMVTFVDEAKVRRKRDAGRCFVRAGFSRLVERTKELNLVVLRQEPAAMPPAEAPCGAQAVLLWGAA